jgi:heme/copper-type cytochrome/quinol oxidase subunit 2
VQRYSIPGRTLETWMRADRPGTFYGQCNQICGTNHWFMPIVVRAVPQAEFEAWAAEAQTRFAQGLPPGAPRAVASTGAPAEPTQITSPRPAARRPRSQHQKRIIRWRPRHTPMTTTTTTSRTS